MRKRLLKRQQQRRDQEYAVVDIGVMTQQQTPGKGQSHCDFQSFAPAQYKQTNSNKRPECQFDTKTAPDKCQEPAEVRHPVNGMFEVGEACQCQIAGRPVESLDSKGGSYDHSHADSSTYQRF